MAWRGGRVYPEWGEQPSGGRLRNERIIEGAERGARVIVPSLQLSSVHVCGRDGVVAFR